MDKEKVQKEVKKEVHPEPKAEVQEEELSLEDKIISQLQLTEVDHAEKKAPEPVMPRKTSNFKMINLSREPEPSGLDDDFEFEFINLDDE